MAPSSQKTTLAQNGPYTSRNHVSAVLSVLFKINLWKSDFLKSGTWSAPPNEGPEQRRRPVRSRSLSASPQSGPVANVTRVGSHGMELRRPASLAQHGADQTGAGHGAGRARSLSCGAVLVFVCSPLRHLWAAPGLHDGRGSCHAHWCTYFCGNVSFRFSKNSIAASCGTCIFNPTGNAKL